jgi:hypothetical protein
MEQSSIRHRRQQSVPQSNCPPLMRKDITLQTASPPLGFRNFKRNS